MGNYWTLKKKREKASLDQLLVERGLAESRQRAQRLILAGAVRVDGQIADKPGRRVAADAEIALDEEPRYVSRGGIKLEAALDRFGIDVHEAIACDVGASTGGFTDCLLQRGAAVVYAIDVGYGQLAWALRRDPRVVVLERTNIRHLESLPEPIDLATIDVSFISLELVLPKVTTLLKPRGQIIALIKPQFEAGRKQVLSGGVVRDAQVMRQVLHKVIELAHRLQLRVLGLTPSPLLGPAGNLEFFIHPSRDAGLAEIDVDGAVEAALSEAARVMARD
ncbi:MAG: TlyA family RNA methyltransferase [Chloroflexi bacterium]|nr:TlyA family RNA methyltransferase [Chloroflexota bacterium]